MYAKLGSGTVIGSSSASEGPSVSLESSVQASAATERMEAASSRTLKMRIRSLLQAEESGLGVRIEDSI
jgi:hypothetical protein